ncbi:TKL protein kinase [Saprolegnia parasitica CBS 223.65]|uniref:TKL protein kinase n=1 Tax=Saprolegnia parasitica (strain CBS 223.65) TaxID=695850 RepID=A0A067BSE4_SAPPC|nr:TKL protein kinase [Saprolegnia parasitica CBS 223.65]KDO19725.1 TKL protein kinase [Saprolegnia parasitica CBS 223.65]|eukprot:XP_012209584.1 TKL protein kinase [Saprolegnia parasitica CBS 223.65]
MCAVTEYLENGDVAAYLAVHRNVEFDVKISIGLGVLNAVQYLHSLDPPVIHRDLKGRNVLLSDALDAKLSDFGISRQRIADETMTVGVGTAFWTAPEVLLGLKYDASVDVYSFGVIMTELDTQHAPYADIKGVPSMHIVQKVTGQDGAVTPLRPTLTRDAPAWFVATAAACLDRDPARRPSISELRDRFAQALGALRADAR